MPHYTGTAADYSALRTAIFDAAEDNGWTLVGDILTKGSVAVKLTLPGNGIGIQGGTGESGGSLVNPGIVPRLGPPGSGSATPTWPVNYDIHLFDAPTDEVYVFVNFNVDYYYWLAWGVSTVDGLPGTGLWVSANGRNTSQTQAGIDCRPSQGGANTCTSGGLFWHSNNADNGCNSAIHTGFSGFEWTGQYNNEGNFNAVLALEPLMERSPNAWNGETVLLPVRGYAKRSDSKVSLVCDLFAARYVRIDNYTPGQLVWLGFVWGKVYPFYRKDASNRDGGNNVTHSGTMGLIVVYDGEVP